MANIVVGAQIIDSLTASGLRRFNPSDLRGYIKSEGKRDDVYGAMALLGDEIAQGNAQRNHFLM